MMKNKGITQTVIHDGTTTKNSNIEWNANYDGEKANINVDISNNGKRKQMLIQLDNADLSKLLQVPSINQSLESRLEEDFPIQQQQQPPQQQVFLIENPMRRRRRIRRITKRKRTPTRNSTRRTNSSKRNSSKKINSSSRRRSIIF
jgi:hypothetical protein